MDINKAMSISFQKDIKVYPVFVGRYIKIEYKIGKQKIKQFDKLLSQGAKGRHDVSEAVKKTYIYFANKILKGEM